MMRKFLGVVILVLVVVGAVGWQWYQTRRPPAVTVVGRIGVTGCKFCQPSQPIEIQ